MTLLQGPKDPVLLTLTYEPNLAKFNFPKVQSAPYKFFGKTAGCLNVLCGLTKGTYLNDVQFFCTEGQNRASNRDMS